MNHRVIILAASVLIVAASVGGVVYVEWPGRSASQTESVLQGTPGIETVQEPTPATHSPVTSLPQPIVGPPEAEATEPSLGQLEVTPVRITAGVPTTVFAEILISNPQLIPASVNLQRLDQTGKVVQILSPMSDGGRSGDRIANDRRYSIEVIFNESAEENSPPRICCI